MKKFILIVAVTIFLAACHSSSVKVEVNEDSVLTKYKVDTIKVDSVNIDTTK